MTSALDNKTDTGVIGNASINLDPTVSKMFKTTIGLNGRYCNLYDHSMKCCLSIVNDQFTIRLDIPTEDLTTCKRPYGMAIQPRHNSATEGHWVRSRISIGSLNPVFSFLSPSFVSEDFFGARLQLSRVNSLPLH